jgi:hypothetical protein
LTTSNPDISVEAFISHPTLTSLERAKGRSLKKLSAISKRENCYCFWEKVFTEQVASEDLKELWEEKVDFGKIYDYSEDNKTGFILEIPNGIIKIIGEIGKKVVVICKDNKVKVYNLSLPKNCNLYLGDTKKWLKEQPIPTFIPSANYTYILFCVNKM